MAEPKQQIDPIAGYLNKMYAEQAAAKKATPAPSAAPTVATATKEPAKASEDATEAKEKTLTQKFIALQKYCFIAGVAGGVLFHPVTFSSQSFWGQSLGAGAGAFLKVAAVPYKSANVLTQDLHMPALLQDGIVGIGGTVVHAAGGLAVSAGAAVGTPIGVMLSYGYNAIENNLPVNAAQDREAKRLISMGNKPVEQWAPASQKAVQIRTQSISQMIADPAVPRTVAKLMAGTPLYDCFPTANGKEDMCRPSSAQPIAKDQDVAIYAGVAGDKNMVNKDNKDGVRTLVAYFNDSKKLTYGWVAGNPGKGNSFAVKGYSPEIPVYHLPRNSGDVALKFVP